MCRRETKEVIDKTQTRIMAVAQMHINIGMKIDYGIEKDDAVAYCFFELVYNLGSSERIASDIFLR